MNFFKHKCLVSILQITTFKISKSRFAQRKKYEIAFIFLNQTSFLRSDQIEHNTKRKKATCAAVRNRYDVGRNKETLSLEWQKSGARGRGSVILLFPNHHRSPRRSNWVRKEGTSSANTSLATPSSSLPPSRSRPWRSPNLWLKKVPDGRSRSLYL